LKNSFNKGKNIKKNNGLIDSSFFKVTQISCFSPNLPPAGCTQYFFGKQTGTIQSYNFGGTNRHLANQDQVICIRKVF